MILNTDNISIHYIQSGPTDGEPIVFVHGNWATCSWWEPVLALLPGLYRGIAYDLRGRGRTQAPDNEYTLAEHADDLLSLLDGLDFDKVHLVGHSLGSAVAMQFALEYPSRVKTLVAVAPAWVDGMPAAYNAPEGQEIIKANKEMFAAALKALAPTAPKDDFWQRLVDEGHEQKLTAALKNLPALVDWRPGNRLNTLVDAGIHTLVISGTLDPLTGGANAERAAQALRAERVILPNIGHSPNLEAPKEFVRIIIAAIEAHKT